MPVHLKPTEFHVKDESTGNYLDINALAEQSTAQTVAAVTAEGAEQISVIQTKGQETIDSIPEDYTNLSNEVSDLNRAFENVTEKTRNIWINPEYNENGIVITPNSDGSIHIQGTPTNALYIDAEGDII